MVYTMPLFFFGKNAKHRLPQIGPESHDSAAAVINRQNLTLF